MSEEKAGARPGRKPERPPGSRRGLFRRRRLCKFCVEKIDYISYRDVKLLTPFIPERGKIQPRRISGVCATHQRRLALAIKRARQMALIPYTVE